MIKIKCQRKDIEVFLLSAGHYYADAGAALGVLPYKLWKDKIEYDEFLRVKIGLNCLLIKSDSKNILVDCGIGDYISDRQRKIYNPSESNLLNDLSVNINNDDIDTVILTHLHFDHAGGILNKEKELLFNKARYIIQEKEWAVALKPDSLNAAAYPLMEHYSALENSGLIYLINGDYEIVKDVHVLKIDGHSPGMQIIKIIDNNQVIYFASDAFPIKEHLTPSITSSYDLSRKDLHKNKENIINDLKKHGGKLVFSHEIENPVLDFNCSL